MTAAKSPDSKGAEVFSPRERAAARLRVRDSCYAVSVVHWIGGVCREGVRGHHEKGTTVSSKRKRAVVRTREAQGKASVRHERARRMAHRVELSLSPSAALNLPAGRCRWAPAEKKSDGASVKGRAVASNAKAPRTADLTSTQGVVIATRRSTERKAQADRWTKAVAKKGRRKLSPQTKISRS